MRWDLKWDKWEYVGIINEKWSSTPDFSVPYHADVLVGNIIVKCVRKLGEKIAKFLLNTETYDVMLKIVLTGKNC